MENEKLEKFLNNRKPFYIDSETCLVKFPAQKHMNVSHAKWFNEMGIVYLHTLRGYYMNIEGQDPYIMIYSNDFDIPNLVTNLFSYLFEYFPEITWIGVGCIKGEVGDVWKPRLKITKV